jgi:hypothetical protein
VAAATLAMMTLRVRLLDVRICLPIPSARIRARRRLRWASRPRVIRFAFRDQSYALAVKGRNSACTVGRWIVTLM